MIDLLLKLNGVLKKNMESIEEKLECKPKIQT